MLNSIIRLALRYRLLVLCLSLVVLVYGGWLTTQLPIDIFPDLDRPRVAIMTEAPGYAAEDMEKLVTFEVESAMLGASGVQDVRSMSVSGLSIVYVEFDWGANIYLARQTVQERLNTVRDRLPPGLQPQLGPIASIMGQIIHIGLHARPGAEAGDTTGLARSSPAELRTLADWVLRPQLLKTPGVAQVLVQGGERRQYQVLLDPALLLQHEVTLAEVEQALRRNNLDASGGVHVQGDTERPVRILGRLGPTPAEVRRQLEQIVVKPGSPRAVTVAQVARVVEGAELKRADASINGFPGVVLTVAKQPHADTRTLTDAIHRTLDRVEQSLPPTVVLNRDLFQMKHFIDRAVFNVMEALVIGAVLVIIVLFLFLLNFRTTFISLLAIPLSLVLTTLVFRLVGWLSGTQLTLNVMTLGGIAVALGELVDDAVVDVENIFRRLKEWNVARLAGEPLGQHSPLRVIYDASVEVRGAIVFGTAMVILVFLPLFALSGLEGRLFPPLGMAYIISILASLLVSLTVTPVLSYYLLPSARATQHAGDGWLLRGMKWCAARLIRLSLAIPGILLALTWLLVLTAGVVMWNLGSDFLPQFDEGSVQVNIALPPDSSLEASNKACDLVDATLKDFQKSATNPEGFVLHFARRTGRAEGDEHPAPVYGTEYLVAIAPETPFSRQEVMKQIEDRVREHVPGVDVEVEQPLMHLIDHMLSGVTAQIAIKIHGEDLHVLRQVAGRVKQAIGDVAGLKTPVIESQTYVEEVHLRLRPERLTFYGLDRESVVDYLQAALGGAHVSQVLEGQRRFDLLVRLDDKYRTDLTHLGRLRVPLPGGKEQIPLSELVEIGIASGANIVNRENGLRRLVVRCNATGRDLGSVVEDIQDRLRTQVQLPAGYTLELAGQFENQRAAFWRILLLSLAALFGMFAILYMLFPSWRIVLQILNALPAAFIGGVVALWLTGQTVTVASLVGFISLGGIAARNGILLVTHYFHLMRHEGERFTQHMILRGSLERLAPVLMTALTAALGLLPLVLGGQQPGREILYPVATVILGGLLSCTLCEFLLHPGLFWRFSSKDVARLTAVRKEGEW